MATKTREFEEIEQEYELVDVVGNATWQVIYQLI